MQHSLIMRNFLLIFSVGFDIKPQQCIFLTFQFLFDANKPLMIFILKKFFQWNGAGANFFKRKILQTSRGMNLSFYLHNFRQRPL